MYTFTYALTVRFVSKCSIKICFCIHSQATEQWMKRPINSFLSQTKALLQNNGETIPATLMKSWNTTERYPEIYWMISGRFTPWILRCLDTKSICLLNRRLTLLLQRSPRTASSKCLPKHAMSGVPENGFRQTFQRNNIRHEDVYWHQKLRQSHITTKNTNCCGKQNNNRFPVKKESKNSLGKKVLVFICQRHLHRAQGNKKSPDSKQNGLPHALTNEPDKESVHTKTEPCGLQVSLQCFFVRDTFSTDNVASVSFLDTNVTSLKDK